MKTRRKKKAGFKVSTIDYPARHLLTVRRSEKRARLKPEDIEGRLIRYEPGAEDTPDEVEMVRQQFLEMGAAAVKLLPQPPGEQVVDDYQLVEAFDGSLRQAVLDKAAAVKNSRDPEALKAYLEEKLEEESL